MRRLDHIVRVVEDEYDLEPGSLAMPCRTLSDTRARQIAAWLMRSAEPHPSFREIGAALGRDYSTIIHAVRRVEVRRASNPRYREETDELRRRVCET